MRLGILASHPIQYQAPLFRALAKEVDLRVYFAHRQTERQHGEAGFGVGFQWDTDLLGDYEHSFLVNRARTPRVDRFGGCDTPGIADEVGRRRFEAFLVMGWNLRSYWQAVSACRRQGVPVLVRGDSQLGTRRTLPTRALKSVLYPWMLKRFDGYLVVGRRSREYLFHYGADPQRMFFCPHAVDNDWFEKRSQESRAEAAELRREVLADRDGTIVLFVGKFIAKKRPLDMVEAVLRLRQRGHAIVGLFAGDGPLRPKIEKMSAGQSDCIRLLGFKNQSELPAVYGASDVLALPSDGGETWGLVVNEAMACGRPAVVSEAVGCAPDLIDPGKTGWTHPLGDIDRLCESLALSASLPDVAAMTEAIGKKMRRFSIATAVAGIVEAAKALRQ